MTWNGDAIAKKIREDAAAGLLDGAEYLLEEALRIVPLEDSDLARSGSTSVDDDALQAATSFDTPYAIPQHENLDYRHDPGRQAKYLEEPLASKAQQIKRIIAKPIQQGLR